MAKKEKQPIPPDKLELYEKLVQSVPEIELIWGFGFPYTSLNGHMFSFLAKTGSAGIRLPKKDREQFLIDYNTTLFENHNGPVLKEYVQIPDNLLKETEVLVPYLKKGLAFVQTLKPKPTKKKK